MIPIRCWLKATILINSIALLSSIKPSQRTKKTSVSSIILLGLLLAPFLIGALGNLSETEKLEKATAWFFEIKIPTFIIVSLTPLYFSCWAIMGILRKFTREGDPLFTRKGAFLFMLGFEFILLGLFYHYLKKSEMETGYLYWTISLLAVLTIPLGALRSFDKYLEFSGLIQRRSTSDINMITRFTLYSNISLGFVLFVLWSAGSLATSLIRGLDIFPELYRIWIIFSFYLFFILLLELYVLYKPLSGKIGHLLSFFGAVYMIFPLILSAALKSKIIYLYSPLGFFVQLHKSEPAFAVQTSIWIVNSLLCVIPILLIHKRYIHVLILRRRM